MATLAEIDAEIARRQQVAPLQAAPSLADIDAEIARRQQAQQPIVEAPAVQQETQPDIQVLLSQFEQAKQSGDFQTADQIRQQISQIQSGAIQGGLEAAGTIASGIVAEPIAGISGIVAEAVPGGRTGAEQVAATQEALTLQPGSQQGQEAIKDIGALAEPIGRAVSAVEDTLGDVTFELTGSPELAAAAKTAPTLAAELLGLGALRKLRVGTKLLDDAGRPTKALRKSLDKKGLVFDNLTPEAKRSIPAIADQSFVTGKALVPSNAEKALVQQIKSGGRDDALAGLAVVDGKVSPDARGLEAMKQGYTPGFVQSIKTMTPETKAQAKKMVEIARRIKKKERVGLDIRPGNVVGESVTNRIKFIRNAASDASKELNQLAKRSLPGKDIDPNIVLNKLRESLDDLKITAVDDGTGVPKLDFKGSLISKDKGSQRAIRDAVDLLSEDGAPDALRAHELKRQMDNIIDFKKRSSQGLGEEGRKVLKGLRSALNDSVRAVDADYARVNDVMHSSLTALDDFQKAAGTTIDIFGEGANSSIGTKMRGLMSNIQSRVNLENATNQLDTVARDLSTTTGKRVALPGAAGKARATINLNDDIKDLTMMANALDARFGAVAKTSFQGNIEQAINRVLNQGVSQEILQQGAGIASRNINKLRGVNEFNAFEAMLDLLGDQR